MATPDPLLLNNLSAAVAGVYTGVYPSTGLQDATVAFLQDAFAEYERRVRSADQARAARERNTFDARREMVHVILQARRDLIVDRRRRTSLPIPHGDIPIAVHTWLRGNHQRYDLDLEKIPSIDFITSAISESETGVRADRVTAPSTSGA